MLPHRRPVSNSCAGDPAAVLLREMKPNRITLCVALLALLALFALLLPCAGILAGDARKDDILCEWKDVERIVAVGDVHGDFDQFEKALRAAKVIDKKNKWIAGKTHLVQIGDVPDRGPDTRKAMDLLMQLEDQAKEAGGRVHAIIGNHEAMVMTGDLRYTHRGEIESFGGREETIKAYSPKGKYGKWILTHNAVIKINDILFVHGGISPRYAKKPLAEINRAVRTELAAGMKGSNTTIADPGGPLWYRGLAMNQKGDLDALADPALEFHKVKRIVIGHTPTRGNIEAKNGGKVIEIDVGMCRHYGGPAACLLIEKGEFFDVRPDARHKLEVK